MSLFAVTIETIGDVREHTNPDRLEMATLAGKDYDFVVANELPTVPILAYDVTLREWLGEQTIRWSLEVCE